jgi:hypothetical protein
MTRTMYISLSRLTGQAGKPDVQVRRGRKTRAERESARKTRAELDAIR